ncbi:hypothetical protein U27_00723 [Candidatus Vecturithrix granuli]|uniref:Uncharacterized protein n=1 Tax=Vecturithrix granuli TaxID=1499967 RepID=A0A081C8C0_VECG1|nr:hypothetical protein U27_00723 [Candidatus Vecturithrix granuli]
MMLVQKFWSKERFPVVYEHNHAKAVIVDISSFEKIEMILDNLLNRDVEEEDRLLAASGLLEQLLNEARNTAPTQQWRTELNAL